MPCLCVPLRRAPHRYNYQPSAWTWNCHCPIGRKGGDSPSHPTPITCKVVIEIPGWFPEHGVDWSHGWGSRIAMESVFLLSHSPLPASAPPPHLSQAPRTSSSPSSQLRKDWETALTFVLRFTSNQFFSNPKEGLSPKSQMFPTIVTGRLRTGWESPHFLLTPCFHIAPLSMLSLTWECLALHDSSAQPAQGLQASSQSTKHQGIRQCVYWRSRVPGSGWPWSTVSPTAEWLSSACLTSKLQSLSMCKMELRGTSRIDERD